jgi:adenosylcobinamide-GDP ribazoletransferase
MWFPVVGLLLGWLYAGVWLGLSTHFSNSTAILLTIALGFLISGGFHEDGLADTCDALGGGYTKEDVLRILKDSRIGTFGTLGLIAVLATRFSLLLEINHLKGWVLGQSLSRVAPVVLLGLIPYATNPNAQSKSRDVARSGKIQAIVVTLLAVLISYLGIVLGWMNLSAVLIMWIGVIILTCILGWRFYKRVGGLTGDFLGTTQQLTEVTILCLMIS